MKKLLFLILSIFFTFCYAQKQNDHWIIGNKLVKFKYNSTSDFEIILPYLSKNFDQSPAIVSDKTTGELLFYTDGETIWNHTKATMDNGSEINGTSTLAQAAIIVPNPSNQNQYYIFTLKAINLSNNNLYYSIVDMSLNSGAGKVISKNNLLLESIDNEKLASTYGHDKSYFWIIVRKDKEYYSYKLNSFGIQNPVISTTNLSSSNEYSRKQKLKISPDSKYVASTINSEKHYNIYSIQLLNFNNSSGKLAEYKTQYDWDFIIDYTINNNQNISYDFSFDSKYFAYKTIHGFLCTCSSPYGIYAKVLNLKDQVISSYLEGISFGINTDIQLGADNNLYLVNNNLNNAAGNYYKIVPNDIYSNAQGVKGILNNYPITINLIRGGLPQLVQTTQNVCQQDLTINQPILSSHNYTASNTITASSVINENLTVNYNAKKVILKPGFKASKTNFIAKVNPCMSNFILDDQTSKMSSVYKTETKIENRTIVSPNPTSNQVQINSTIGINEWFVYDINAKIVLTGNNKNANALKINLQNLNAGIYYFKFLDASGTLHEKSIIKK
ncbi:Por secretion system C-terminal sorting domain-containing protein [Algoriella xinjiangensis]|uniref:Por secretion system C-terminal sorting domain-containing protein n=1 Tax=Algoriella xinjiangensis TaxID=684065 RepID=A0A1I5AH13_9FLAO|nr:3-coathanger stack domain-containing protein [Algoriella xinjiangensis]SFN61764.1 Por secretion system C-terminal sorting domain-containing protein [Algoriella xinjiangensis]VDH16244.1 Por secretion system C-terminal sorting domain [Algoriella xinjiangensis]